MHRKVTQNYDRDIQHTYKKGRKKEIKKQHTSRQKEQRYNERSNETTGLATRRGRKNKMCCSRKHTKHTEKDTETVRWKETRRGRRIENRRCCKSITENSRKWRCVRKKNEKDRIKGSRRSLWRMVNFSA